MSPSNRSAKQTVAVVRQLLEGCDKVLIATVFGSVAKGRLHPHSDIDIAVAGNERFSIDERIRMQEDLAIATGRPVDLVDLWTAEGFILTQSLAKGTMIIHRSPDVHRRLMKKMWYWNADMAPLVRASLEKKARRFIGDTRNHSTEN
jgi:predicted nucleotidyltransferase